MSEPPPNVVVIAGPNGAGKSTFAARLLTDAFAVEAFVNADVIAKRLGDPDSTSVAIAAGREMLDRLDDLERQGVSFAFETTLASRTLAPRLARLMAAGYRSHLIFLWLPSADIAIKRVATRRAQGGHDVPTETIVRRHKRGWQNFLGIYAALFNTWEIYDAALTPAPCEIARGGRGVETHVSDQVKWKRVNAGANP